MHVLHAINISGTTHKLVTMAASGDVNWENRKRDLLGTLEYMYLPIQNPSIGGCKLPVTIKDENTPSNSEGGPAILGVS